MTRQIFLNLIYFLQAATPPLLITRYTLHITHFLIQECQHFRWPDFVSSRLFGFLASQLCSFAASQCRSFAASNLSAISLELGKNSIRNFSYSGSQTSSRKSHKTTPLQKLSEGKRVSYWKEFGTRCPRSLNGIASTHTLPL